MPMAVTDATMADATMADATMAERSERLLAPASWKAAMLLGAGLIISSVAHMALLGTVLFASASPNEAPPPKSITVDLVPEKDAPPVVKLELPKPEPLRPALEMPTLEKQAQQSSSSSASAPRAAAARQQLAAAQKSTPPSPAPQQSAPEAKATQPEPRPAQSEPVTEDTGVTAARIAQMLHLSELDPTATFEAPPSENSARLSRKEIAALKAHLEKCWAPPAGVPREEKLKVLLRVALSPQGRLAKAPVLLAGSPSIHGPALFKSALDALARCQPYAMLPAKKYKDWKLLDLNFTPGEIVAINSGSGFQSTKSIR
jgi:hypothetical protein